jgi:hypothetical protein
MRGFPPLQLVIAIIGLALLAIPLVHLTRGAARSQSSETSAVPPAVKATSRSAVVRVRFAHEPLRLKIRQGDRILLSAVPAVKSPLESEVPIFIGAQAPDFFVEAAWPAGTPETAVTLEIEPDSLETQADTAWSDQGVMNCLFHLAWK